MAKNNNFNYKPVSNVLSANHGSGALAVAEDIAYSWSDTTLNPMGGAEFVMAQTVKEKIQELEANIQNPESIAEIEQDVNTIKGQLTTLSSDIASAHQDAQDAAQAKLDTQAMVTSISEVSDKVDQIDEIAQNLAANLNFDATYEVLTTTAYNQKVANKQLNPNTIYFLYDGIESLKYSIYARPIDDSMGTVTYSDEHINVSKGSQVTITATPKAGYIFAAWKSASENSESMETVSTNSSYTVTINSDKEYIAWFNIDVQD